MNHPSHPTGGALLSQELYRQVHQYALDHYTDGGWDVIVECFSKEELEEILVGTETTLEEVIASLAPVIDVWADRQADARNSAF